MLKIILFKRVKIIKWFLISFIMLLGVIEFIADQFFDHAAQKDGCADSGGAWNYQNNTCQHNSDNSRTKESDYK